MLKRHARMMMELYSAASLFLFCSQPKKYLFYLRGNLPLGTFIHTKRLSQPVFYTLG